MRQTNLPNLDQLRPVPLLAIRLHLFAIAGLLPGVLHAQSFDVEAVLLGTDSGSRSSGTRAGCCSRC